MTQYDLDRIESEYNELVAKEKADHDTFVRQYRRRELRELLRGLGIMALSLSIVTGLLMGIAWLVGWALAAGYHN